MYKCIDEKGIASSLPFRRDTQQQQQMTERANVRECEKVATAKTVTQYQPVAVAQRNNGSTCQQKHGLFNF